MFEIFNVQKSRNVVCKIFEHPGTINNVFWLGIPEKIFKEISVVLKLEIFEDAKRNM